MVWHCGSPSSSELVREASRPCHVVLSLLVAGGKSQENESISGLKSQVPLFLLALVFRQELNQGWLDLCGTRKG